MKKRTLSTIIISIMAVTLISLTAKISKGQDTSSLYIPDRPGYAANAYIIGISQASYETSIGYSYYNPTTTIYQTNLFRAGTCKHFELRFGFDDAGFNMPDGSIDFGIKDISIGAKIPIVQDLKYLPDIAILGGTIIKNSGYELLAPTTYVPSIAFIAQKVFGNLVLIGNAGVFWDGFTEDGISFANPYSVNRKAQGSYAIAAYYFIKDLGLFCETYGYYNQYTNHYAGCDLGANYYINPDLVLDLSCGINYKQSFDNVFVNFGLGWRFDKKLY
jgi:hypothetical protein